MNANPPDFSGEKRVFDGLERLRKTATVSASTRTKARPVKKAIAKKATEKKG